MDTQITTSRPFLLTTADGLSLSAHIFETKNQAKGSILLAPGLGIPKEVYFKYATFLASAGYHTLVFDYRGIGEKHLKMKDPEIMNLRNWAIQDMVAGINWLSDNYPSCEIYGVLHSIGGQVLGLVENHTKFKRVIFISTVGGYWKDEVFPVNLFTWYMWYIHIPLLTSIFGYLPKGFTYRGIAIAKGVAKEWAEWGKKSQYIKAFFGKSIPQQFYDEIKIPIDAIWFTDDQLVTEKTLTCILDMYTSATLKKWPINPRDMDLVKIGHSGFFSSKSREKLWDLSLGILAGERDA